MTEGAKETIKQAALRLVHEAGVNGISRADLRRALRAVGRWSETTVRQSQVGPHIREGRIVPGYPHMLWASVHAPDPIPQNPAKRLYTVDMQCEHCGEAYKGRMADVRNGRRYCGQRCAGRAKLVCPDDKKKRKSAYDRQYRAEKGDKLRAQSRAYYYANHEENLRKAKALRATPEWKRKHKAYLEQYNARPEWKEHKREYDRRYRAEKEYGSEWAEVVVALGSLSDHLNSVEGGNKARQYERGRQNRTTKNKRALKRGE